MKHGLGLGRGSTQGGGRVFGAGWDGRGNTRIPLSGAITVPQRGKIMEMT